MIDLRLIEGFDWDDGNRHKSADKHGVSNAEAEQVFFNAPLRIAPDDHHSQAEARFYALGQTSDGRRLYVAFTLRRSGTLIRVISARAMDREERATYGQET